MFSEVGYKVDYIHGKEVTVDFYRSLPEQNYKYIILRAHSSLFSRDTMPEFREELTLATTERYSDSIYREEQRKGQVVPFKLFREDTRYFAITSRFIKSRMQGNLNDATIILMGCNGLTYTRMAQVLVQKGAGTVIGWDKKVSLKHTDLITKVLLDSLLEWKMEVNEAVGKVTTVFGEDREYGSKLLVYP